MVSLQVSQSHQKESKLLKSFIERNHAGPTGQMGYEGGTWTSVGSGGAGVLSAT